MVIELISLFATLVSCAPETTIEQYSREVIHDFSGNRFILEENENSYSIYDSSGNFIEGSDNTNSPYFDYEEINKYYLGPSNYFIEINNKIIDVLNDHEYSFEEMGGATYSLSDINSKSGNEGDVSDINEENTFKNTDDFLMIKNANYFERLRNFPENWFGECGLVALSILLGYFDTFYHDDFIPNDKMYTARFYEKSNTKSGRNDGDLNLKSERDQLLLEKEITAYQEDSSINYSFEKYWEMPGTTYAMRDYLFDNYLHTFLGLGSQSYGYPMLDKELHDTMNDYLNDNCSNITKFINLYNSNSGSDTNKHLVNFINEGFPILAILKSYEYSNSSRSKKEQKNHIVVCYGYKYDEVTDKYIYVAHFGWTPGSDESAKIKFTSDDIYGYFGMKFDGGHVHSSNVYMTNYKNVTKYSCPCGLIHSEIYDIFPEDWNFEERYYFENEGIKETKFTLENFEVDTSRLRCGFIENEVINLSPNRLDAGEAYFEMKFNKYIKQMDVDISFWSDEEYLNKFLGDYAYIQIKDKLGVWQNEIDLLDYGISTDRYNQTKISISIPQCTKSIRFIAHVEIPLSARNKGRISIGNMKLYVSSF